MLIISGIVSALRAMLWGGCLLGISIFMYSLLLTRLFGKTGGITGNAVEGSLYQEYFGSVPRTAFTLLQFTMEFQPDLCRQTWNDGFVLTFLLILYTFYTNITILNIISSMMVDTILSTSSSMKSQELERADLEDEHNQRDYLKSVFQEADKDGDAFLDAKEFTRHDSSLQKAMQAVGVDPSEARELHRVLDHSKSGRVSLHDFSNGLMRIRRPLQPKHVLQIECKIEALNIKMENSMAQVLSLREQFLDPANHQKDCQDKFSERLLAPELHDGTRGLTERLVVAVQSEQQRLRSDLAAKMDTCSSSLQDLHLQLLNFWECLDAKYVNLQSLSPDGAELSSKCHTEAYRGLIGFPRIS